MNIICLIDKLKKRGWWLDNHFYRNNHEFLTEFAEEILKEQLRISSVSNRRELLISWIITELNKITMTENEQNIIDGTKEFAKTHNIHYDKMTENMILNALREQLTLTNVSDCPFESYAVFCIECDRQGLKPINHKDYLNLGCR